MISFNFTVPASHPALEGHFPGNHVVPGVVILDEITYQLALKDPLMKIAGIPQVKFLKPLKPGVVVDVSVNEKKPLLYQFTCSTNEGVIANGQLRTQAEQKK
jgi:3-hydroxymyristoyl/3-hydroxydecanoyl-(acyl carrier protein) dehydratase